MSFLQIIFDLKIYLVILESVKNTISKMINNRRMVPQRKNAFSEDNLTEKKQVKNIFFFSFFDLTFRNKKLMMILLQFWNV